MYTSTATSISTQLSINESKILLSDLCLKKGGRDPRDTGGVGKVPRADMQKVRRFKYKKNCEVSHMSPSASADIWSYPIVQSGLKNIIRSKGGIVGWNMHWIGRCDVIFDRVSVPAQGILCHHRC